MATLMLDEGGTVFEIEYMSTGEYRERMYHPRVKMAQFLVGCAQVILNIGQCVLSFPTIGRGKINSLKYN
jgi:hypothetical protein